MKLRVEGVSWGVAERGILEDVSLEVETGEMVGLIGPNGGGKTSLLRCVYSFLEPWSGSVTLDGEDVRGMGARRLARRVAVVLQETPSGFDFTVRESVLMGRTPHKSLFDRETVEDRRIVEHALERVGALDLAERDFRTLSGGERQKVLVARALTQNTRLLVLDEPTNHLDVGHQLEVLELVKSLGVSTLAALHDLNLAALFCDRLYVLKSGRVFASGTPEEVLASQLLQEVYGVASEVRIHPATGRPHVTFLPTSLTSGERDRTAG